MCPRLRQVALLEEQISRLLLASSTPGAAGAPLQAPGSASPQKQQPNSLAQTGRRRSVFELVRAADKAMSPLICVAGATVNQHRRRSTGQHLCCAVRQPNNPPFALALHFEHCALSFQHGYFLAMTQPAPSNQA